MWRIKASGEGIPFGHMSNYYVEAVEKPVLLIHARVTNSTNIQFVDDLQGQHLELGGAYEK